MLKVLMIKLEKLDMIERQQSWVNLSVEGARMQVLAVRAHLLLLLHDAGVWRAEATGRVPS